jgi:hypothetical protein
MISILREDETLNRYVEMYSDPIYRLDNKGAARYGQGA